MGGSSAGSSGSGGEGGASPVPDAECADLGGLCTPIGDCLSAGDHFAAEDPCAGPEQACCVPSAACGGPEETIKCCEGGATYRPACDNGEFVCVVGEPHDLNFNCGE